MNLHHSAIHSTSSVTAVGGMRLADAEGPVAEAQTLASPPQSEAGMLIDSLARRNATLVARHPFVRRCASGEAALPELRLFLAQHGKYGAHFTRLLCATIGNLRDTGDVADLACNLAEELGYGAAPGEPHSAMYARMLAEFGIDQASTPTLPGTRKLIDTMFAYCRRENPAFGLAALCLGAESIVPTLYGDLIKGFLACGVPEDRLAFFRVHVDCDDGHGRVMRDILVRMLTQDPALRDAVCEAAAWTIDARLEFFTGIQRAAA